MLKDKLPDTNVYIYHYDSESCYSNIEYNGFNAKVLWDPTKFDRICSFNFDFSDYEAYINGEYGKKSLGDKRLTKEVDKKISSAANAYNSIFGHNIGEIVYNFSESNTENITLILVDFFSNPINELFASHFKETRIVDLRNYKDQKGKEFDIIEYVSKYKIDNIIFMGNTGFFASYEFDIKVGE